MVSGSPVSRLPFCKRSRTFSTQDGASQLHRIPKKVRAEVSLGLCVFAYAVASALVNVGARRDLPFFWCRILANDSTVGTASSAMPVDEAISPIQAWAGHTQSVTSLSLVPDLYKPAGANAKASVVSASLDHSVRVRVPS